MAYRYEVVTLRKQKYDRSADRTFSDEYEAQSYLDSLSGDADCLFAQIHRWPPADPSGTLAADIRLEPLILVGQAERIDGKWRRENNLQGQTLIRKPVDEESSTT